jgi:hypothetical protein
MSVEASRAPIPLYESPFLDADLAAAGHDAETEAFVRALAQDGGALIDLGEEALDLCDQAARDTDPYFADGGVRRVQDAWRRSKAVRALATHPKVRRLLAAAYGRTPFAFQTLNFKQGSEQHFHSDAVHFHSLPERFMCGVWTALEDVHAEAGALVYKLGSHTAPVLTMQDVGVNSPEPTYDDYVRHYVPRFEERLAAQDLPTRRLLIRKGQAFVWSANLAHGGEPISAPGATRRSLVTHFYFDGCAYFTPMTSNPQAGRLTLRLPQDIASGWWRWPRRDGRPIALPFRTVAAAVRDRVRNRPSAF